jgi:ribosomal-protein-alanine N-acetyltransferase
MSGIVVRPMLEGDVAAVAVLQHANPSAAQWLPSDYLAHESYVAEASGRIAGFLVIQSLLPDEAEVLNIAVDHDLKRHGVGRSLLRAAIACRSRILHLEVRESNAAALAFYRSLGFAETGRRRGYYQNPLEDAVLMTRIGS